MEKQERIRTLADQVDEICTRLGIRRKDVADRMGISHPYFSQIVTGRATPKHIEKVAKALDVNPFHFDLYHILTFIDRIEHGEEWANEIARLLIRGQKFPDRKRRDLVGKLAA
jgi:transcriptional regulator with XRE-family HTH domain